MSSAGSFLWLREAETLTGKKVERVDGIRKKTYKSTVVLLFVCFFLFLSDGGVSFFGLSACYPPYPPLKNTDEAFLHICINILLVEPLTHIEVDDALPHASAAILLRLR